MKVLAGSIKEIYNSNSSLKIIGTRHGEKLYETLISREESLRLEESKNFYRIYNDNRDLNYNIYFSQCKKNKKFFEYNSHNTNQLNTKEVL